MDSLRGLQDFLSSSPDVLFLRLHWVDLSGILHTRIIPIAHALKLAGGKSSYSVGPVCMLSTISGAALDEAPIYYPVQLQPDWTSLRHCKFAPRHASVMCYTYCPEDKNPLSLCTRKLLNDVLRRASEETGKTFLVGGEVEFILLDQDLQVRSTTDTIDGWASTAGLRGEVLTMMEEIVLCLADSGIGVWHFHTELAEQLEIALEPLPPVEALDALYYAVETIKSFAVAHGMRATVAPKPLLDGTINGMHLHMSMRPREGSDNFLAGVLRHLQSLLVLGVANYDGYVRVGGRMDNFGSCVSWGTANAEVPIRKVSDAHWELRFIDSTANLYLVLATLISMGLTGVQKQHPLIWKDLRHSPESLSQEQLRRMGITELLPRSLKEGIEFFKNDLVIGDIVGKEMKDYFIRIKEKDRLAFEKMTDEERRRWFVRLF